jgi:hypothetical protein
MAAGDPLPSRPGERIPRRVPQDFEERDEGFFAAIRRDGFFNTALEDANQYGPHGMIALLGIFATVTGLILLLFWKL